MYLNTKDHTSVKEARLAMIKKVFEEREKERQEKEEMENDQTNKKNQESCQCNQKT
jgi:hypothetical protein